MARPPTTWPSASIGRPCERGERGGEAFAARAQRVDQPLHRARLVRLEPGAEGEHAMRRIGAGDQRRIADDLGLVDRRRPGHQDLRVGAQQRVDAVDLGAGRDDLVAGGRFGLGEPRGACAPA